MDPQISHHLRQPSSSCEPAVAQDVKCDKRDDEFYVQVSASQCHLCGSKRHQLMICSNVEQLDFEARPNCRNCICTKCFLKEGWSWEAALQDHSWTCTHCRGRIGKFVYRRSSKKNFRLVPRTLALPPTTASAFLQRRRARGMSHHGGFQRRYLQRLPWNWNADLLRRVPSSLSSGL